MKHLVNVGRIFFGLAITAVGLEHFYYGTFVKRIVPTTSAWLTGRPWPAYLAGAVLAACGVAIVLRRGARPAALLVGAAFLAAAGLGHIPAQLAANPFMLAGWTASLKALALAGGAFLVTAALAPEACAGRAGGLAQFGRYVFAIMLVTFGTNHFVYPAFVARLVPAWIPGALFWTYLGGTALIAAGLGLLTGVKVRLACLLLGSMVFCWFLILHLPRALATPNIENEVTSMGESLAFSGMAFMLAGFAAPRRRGPAA